MRALVVPLLVALSALVTRDAACREVSSPETRRPLVVYTDIISGPNSGGENNKGIYLSIFGKNFGSSGLGTTVKVYINDVEVDNYRYLGPSRGRTDIQQITVQIGALGNPTPGVALPIKVVVNGTSSNTDKTFMVNAGRILFVDNVSGSDTTAVIGDISKPFRHVQTATLSQAAWGQVRAGDFMVLRGRGTPWTDVGFERYFMRYRDKSGSAPTGTSGGAIVLMGYPAEDVYIRGTLASGMTGGCISGINGQSYPTAGKWAVVTNLRIDCEGYDGPVSQQINGDNWRVVNNDLSASTAPRTGTGVPRMAGITGNGTNSVWLGNHIHDIQGSSGECHGIYIDGDGSYEIAYNNIHNIRDGNGFQVYVSGGNGSTVADDIRLHHNLIHDVSKHGINIADGSRNNFAVYNNLVYNVAYAAVRFNTTVLHGAKIYNNTFYRTNTSGNSAYGALTNDWNLPSDALDVQNNIFVPMPGTRYLGGTVGFGRKIGRVARNFWARGRDKPSIDNHPQSGEIIFVREGSDFHLRPGSRAIDAGSPDAASLMTDDYDLTTKRPQGRGFEMGAFELNL